MAKRKQFKTIECKHCYIEFKTRNDNKLFCSNKCKCAWRYADMKLKAKQFEALNK